jgi:hypothetical protein
LSASNSGQILVELLLAISLAAIIFGISGQLLDVTLSSNRLNKERLAASNLMAEGVEAVIAISSEKWQNIYNLTKSSPYHLDNSLGSWVLVSGAENIILNNITFSRSIVVEDVNRDSSRNINSSGSNDPSTQKVTVTVLWNNDSISTSRYFTRSWNNTSVQTDWSGGSGQAGPVTAFNNRYDTDDTNLDTTGTAGSIKLKKK